MAEISIGEYIFTRLAQLGVKSIFGVPGDYELVILDMIPAAGLAWRGNANELIASYAADGYARVNGIGAFVTTFGPGELSAYCGMAGQYAEYVPVVHIVGYPSTTAMNGHAIMHHSLGDGKFGMYQEMIKHISVADTVITDVSVAAAEIDRVLEAMLYHSRPVYIGVPVDIGPKKIPTSTLSTPLVSALPSNVETDESGVVAEILGLLKSRKDPVIVIDGGAVRHDLLEETKALVEKLQIPYFSTLMGKGAVSERLGNGKLFGGIYAGGGSAPSIRATVESSELALWIGQYPSDFNTGEFTTQLQTANTVDFQRFSVSIAGKSHRVTSKYLLQRLVQEISTASAVTPRNITWDPYPDDKYENLGPLVQDFLWPTLGRYLQDGDFVIAETGTSSYGIPGANLSHVDNVRMYNQTVFGSIGYATGAALGSYVAGKEDRSIKRGILVTGEGSLQLTVQTFADLLRHGLNTTIFILNNNGYTIERLIHGKHAPYNTIPVWDYAKLCETFGPNYPSRYYRVATGAELVKLLGDPEFIAADVTQVVELILDTLDAPLFVRNASAAVEAFNSRN